MKTDILLVAETVDDIVTQASRELAGLAASLTAAAGAGKAAFLVCGGDIRAEAEKLAADTGLNIHLVEHPDLRLPHPEAVADIAAGLMTDSGCRTAFFLHTSCGCQAAAKTAIMTESACLAGVDEVKNEADDTVFRSALFNGKMCLETLPAGDRLVVTALPGAFSYEPKEPPSESLPKIKRRPADISSRRCRPLKVEKAFEADTAIDQADILVAAGRGLGSPENLELVENLARLLPNAAVAASRPLCDMNWLPYSRQVGATGKTVAPRLYLACGISGAQQHVYGMKNSQWIVAVNTDPRAAIFSVADYCIVEDLTTFLPALAEVLQKQEG